MSTAQIFKLIAALTCLGLFAACDDGNTFPDEPVINSLSWDNSLEHLIVEFTDGDGDFGIDGEDSRFPLYVNGDSSMVNPYYYNLWIDYFEKQDGEWVLIEPENTFSFRVPVLTPDGQNKQLDVLITNDLSTEIPYLLSESDTIKFRVTMVDRALRESVPMETEVIIAPQ